MTTRTGVYINLDRSTDRRDFMERQIKSLGLDWVKRFPAVDGSRLDLPGDALARNVQGCFLSHLRLLEQSSDDAYIFVFEDDAEISFDLSPLLTVENLMQFGDRDVIFLGCQVICETAQLRACWDSLVVNLRDPAEANDLRAERRLSGVSSYAARDMYAFGTAAYVVSPRGRLRLIQAMREHMATGTPTPIDMLYLNLMRTNALDAVILLPFLASVPTQNSSSLIDASGGKRGLSAKDEAISNMLQRIFYAGPVPDLFAACHAAGVPADFVTSAVDMLVALAGRHFKASLQSV